MTALPAPPRFRGLGLVNYAALLLTMALILSSVAATAPALDRLSRGFSRLFAPSGMLMQMFPSWHPGEPCRSAISSSHRWGCSMASGCFRG